jgi:hypothetical protein
MPSGRNERDKIRADIFTTISRTDIKSCSPILVFYNDILNDVFYQNKLSIISYIIPDCCVSTALNEKLRNIKMAIINGMYQRCISVLYVM